MYILGGHDERNNTQRYIEKFNLENLDWTVLDTGVYFPSGNNGTNRCGALLNNKIYVFTDNETLVFDTNTETFETSLNPLPLSPILSKSITFGNNIYIFGYDINSSTKFAFSFDPIGNSFTDLSYPNNLPRLERFDLAVLNERIVITGGTYDETLIQIYNPNGNAWQSSYIGDITSLPLNGKKKDHTSQVFNGELYLLGGSSLQIVKVTPILF